jgi:maltose O-acetyltransferase
VRRIEAVGRCDVSLRRLSLVVAINLSEGAAVDVHLRNVVNNVVAAGYVVPVKWRVAMMRFAGIEVGDGTEVKSRCTIAGPGKVSFGASGYVNFGCMFDATGDISIGDRVYIAPGVSIGTCTHDVGPANQRAGRRFSDAVRIGDGCWIGMNVTILPGVTIAAGCVVAAGAVIAHDCEPNGLYGGVPARRVRELELEAVAA